jgi:hypothetical protein
MAEMDGIERAPENAQSLVQILSWNAFITAENAENAEEKDLHELHE